MHVRLLVVHGDRRIGEDLRRRLERLGYEVPAVAVTPQEAARRAAELQPRLILVDHRMCGDQRGGDLAAELRFRFRLPVLSVGAQATSHALRHLGRNEAPHVVLDAADDRMLQAAIELSLAREAIASELQMRDEWLDAVLRSSVHAMLGLDRDGHVLWMNAAAEQLTGWDAADAAGHRYAQVLRIKKPRNGGPNSVEAVLSGRVAAVLHDRAIIVQRTGHTVPIEQTAVPVRDPAGVLCGILLVLRATGELTPAPEPLSAA